MQATILTVAALALAPGAASSALAEPARAVPPSTEPAIGSAESVVAAAGVAAGFAVLGPDGRVAGSRPSDPYELGSVTKTMLLLAYLQRPERRERPLSARERALLAPMIRHSSNPEAEAIYRIVGDRGLRRIARQAQMTGFESSHVRTGWTWGWGAARASAADLARLFIRLDELAPTRHRRYVRQLFSSIEASQRWGIPAAADGWRAFFKGGWGHPTDEGVAMAQAALLTRDGERMSLAILTRGNPSYEQGGETIRLIADALLRGR